MGFGKTSKRPIDIVFEIGDLATALTAGLKAYLRVPFACTILSWELVAGTSGSITIDIWKDTYTNFPPTLADTITASAKPMLSGQQKANSSTLTGWTINIAEGDYLAFNIDSVATVKYVRLMLKVQI